MSKRKHVPPARNLRELMEDLTQYLNLTPEQQFRVTAKIKRHVHGEKYMFAYRTLLNNDVMPVMKKSRIKKKWKNHRLRLGWMIEELQNRVKNHQMWSTLPDESVVTWSVGTFTYPPKKAPEAPLTAS